ARPRSAARSCALRRPRRRRRRRCREPHIPRRRSRRPCDRSGAAGNAAARRRCPGDSGWAAFRRRCPARCCRWGRRRKVRACVVPCGPGLARCWQIRHSHRMKHAFVDRAGTVAALQSRALESSPRPSMTSPGDAALDALLLPFADGTLAREAEALFLRARAGAALDPQDWPELACESAFKPDAEALQEAGFTVTDGLAEGSRDRAPTDIGGDAGARPLVLLLPPRQRDEARAAFAEALARAAPGAYVVASVANDAGAKSAEADFARIAGPVSTRSKYKCRVFWARAGQAGADPALAAQWRGLDAPRRIEGGRFLSRPGVFAWDRVDPA